MQIRIVAVGKVKEHYLAQGITEYVKRLQPYARLLMVEIEEERRPASPSPAQKVQAVAREGEKILSAIPEGAYTIALAIHGRLLPSEGLADLLRRQEIRGTKQIVFIIGGDLGLAPVVLEKSGLLLSLSPLTFTHPMARLILVEQVYRAFRIIRNEPYHK